MRRASRSLQHGYNHTAHFSENGVNSTHKSAFRQPQRRQLVTDSTEVTSPIRRVANPVLVAQDAPELVKRRFEILKRAATYGIPDAKSLAFESDLRDISPNKERSRLVDLPPYRNYLNLWEVLLDYQINQYGVKGARTIYLAMAERNKGVVWLSTDEPIVNRLWFKILSVAVQDSHQRLIFLLCVEHGIAWNREQFFAEVIGTLLKHNRDDLAAFWLHKLRHHPSKRKTSAIEIFRIFDPRGTKEIQTFCNMYSKLPLASIYAETVSELCRKGRLADAFLMHVYLVERGDLPDNFEGIESFIQDFAQQNEDPGPFLRQLSESGVSFSNQALRAYSKERSRTIGMSPESLNINASHTFGYKPRNLSDTFVARALSTQALSFHFVVNALQVLGLIELGPQSVRAMGLSAPDLLTLQERFDRLEEMGIDTGSSAYTRLIKALVTAKQNSLLTQALQTDMHHDVFADKDLQGELLAEAYAHQNWPKVNLLIAMLHEGNQIYNQSSTFAFDILLRSAANAEDWRSVLLILHQWLDIKKEAPRSDDIPRLTRQTLEVLISKALYPDDTRTSIPHEEIHRPRFIVGLMQDLMVARLHVPLLAWKEPLRKLAMRGPFEDVERQVVWLAKWYQPVGPSADVLRWSVTRRDMQIGRLFKPAFLQALIVWAFKESFERYTHGQERNPAWKRSLRLVKFLENEYGIEVDFKAIKKVVLGCFQRGLDIQARSFGRPTITPEKLDGFLKYFYSLWHRQVPPNMASRMQPRAASDRRFRLQKIHKRMASEQQVRPPLGRVPMQEPGYVAGLSGDPEVDPWVAEVDDESKVIQDGDPLRPAAQVYDDSKLRVDSAKARRPLMDEKEEPEAVADTDFFQPAVGMYDDSKEDTAAREQRPREEKEAEEEPEVVVYTDFFHPSAEEYSKRDKKSASMKKK